MARVPSSFVHGRRIGVLSALVLCAVVGIVARLLLDLARTASPWEVPAAALAVLCASALLASSEAANRAEALRVFVLCAVVGAGGIWVGGQLASWAAAAAVDVLS